MLTTLGHANGGWTGTLKLYLDAGTFEWLQWSGSEQHPFRSVTDSSNYGFRWRETVSPWTDGELVFGLDHDLYGGEFVERHPSDDRLSSDLTFRNTAPYVMLSHRFARKGGRDPVRRSALQRHPVFRKPMGRPGRHHPGTRRPLDLRQLGPRLQPPGSLRSGPVRRLGPGRQLAGPRGRISRPSGARLVGVDRPFGQGHGISLPRPGRERHSFRPAAAATAAVREHRRLHDQRSRTVVERRGLQAASHCLSAALFRTPTPPPFPTCRRRPPSAA